MDSDVSFRYCYLSFKMAGSKYSLDSNSRTTKVLGTSAGLELRRYGGEPIVVQTCQLVIPARVLERSNTDRTKSAGTPAP